MKTRSGAEWLALELERRGVDVVFGIPGLHNLDLFEALRCRGVRVVTAAHELGVGFLANGYARATGRPGVFVTVPGPGLTNALTAIAEAHLDSCPLIGLVTNVRFDLPRRYQIHQIPQMDVVTPVAKAVWAARAPAELSALLAAAFDLSLAGEPGPVILDISADALAGRAHHPAAPPAPAAPASLAAAALDGLLARLGLARRIGLVVGQGAFGAAPLVPALAERLSAPVFTTLSGRGCLREDHPLSLGFGWGPGGTTAVNAVLDTCDLILALGTRFADLGTDSYHLRLRAPLIHVDASPAVFHHNYPAELTLTADARALAEALLARLPARPADPELAAAIAAARGLQAARQAQRRPAVFQLGAAAGTPAEFYGALRQALPDDALLVTDSGYNQVLTKQYWRVLGPRTFLCPSDYQAMGFAVPAAIGAALACPGRRVAAIVGDGGFAMSGFDILTAVRERVDVLFIVLNDGGYGFIRAAQEATFGVATAVDQATPDFSLLARSFGLRYAASGADLAGTLQAALAAPGPTLLEVRVRHPRRPDWERLQLSWRRDAKRLARRWLRLGRAAGAKQRP